MEPTDKCQKCGKDIVLFQGVWVRIVNKAIAGSYCHPQYQREGVPPEHLPMPAGMKGQYPASSDHR